MTPTKEQKEMTETHKAAVEALEPKKQKEVWRKIPIANRYQASNLGRVRHIAKGNILKFYYHPYGYQKVTLWLGHGKKAFMVHRLVIAAFRGVSDLYVNHKNSIPDDNRIRNLEYVTNRENRNHYHATKERKELPAGVFKRVDGSRTFYVAKIKINKKAIHLGHFSTPEAAGLAYRRMAKSLNESKYAHKGRITRAAATDGVKS